MDLNGETAISRILRKPYCDGTSHSSHSPCRTMSAGPTNTLQWELDIVLNSWSERTLATPIIRTARIFRTVHSREVAPLPDFPCPVRLTKTRSKKTAQIKNL